MAVKKATYGKIDLFRMVAAVWVVAIHTMPLYALSPTVDFVLTRVVGRLAVPFFFLCTGFFVLPRGTAAVRRFCVRTLGLYALALLLYLPLMLYAGYFTRGPFVVLDVLWNGSFYHLWYFPAAIWGVLLCSFLLRHAPRAALPFACLLYAVGLAGDSYAHILQALPLLRAPLGALTAVFGTMRNGLFLAPLFLLLGARCARRPPQKEKKRQYSLLFCLSLGLMVAEGLLLYAQGEMWGDVFYAALPLAAYALFSRLCIAGGRAHPTLRGMSLWVYILHPFLIALLRAVLARLFHLPSAMETGGVWFFPLVVLCTLPPAWVALWLQRRLAELRAPDTRCTARVNLDAIGHNLHMVKTLVPEGCEVMAVVKANAYGHGAVRVARSLYRRGVRWFCVATPAEAIELRRGLVRGNILVLGYTPPNKARAMRLLGVTLTAVDEAHAAALAAQRCGVRVHLKLDTGMHRAGLDAHNAAALYRLRGIRVTGIFSHLASADALDKRSMEFARQQAGRFEEALQALRAEGIQPGLSHLLSTYGLLNHGAHCHGGVRIGLGLYGVVDTARTTAALGFEPALSLHAKVASVRTIGAGESVGYSFGHVCGQSTTVALVTAGYADGVPRALHNGWALVAGHPAPIIGRISMDSLCLDAGALPPLDVGDEVALLGGGAPGAVETAAMAGTIPNEVLARIGTRFHHQYSEGGQSI